MTSAARSRWILVPVLIASIALVWWVRRRPPVYPVAYIGDRSATMWSTTALVRQEVGTLGYGEKVSVIKQSGDQAQVRAENGAQGWVDAHMLMSVGMWQQVADLLTQARRMTPQALGHTRALSNVHASPGRDSPRIFQFGRNVPVFVLERRVVAAPAAGGASTEEGTAANGGKPEDWLYVLRAGPGAASPAPNVESPRPIGAGTSPLGVRTALAAGNDAPIAGWMMARFVELDPPQPIADYASSAAMRIVAWAVLNTVADGEVTKPQYLVAGGHGGEGQLCDFTSLRVYTWSAHAQRYETAYVENNLCGRLPIKLAQTAGGTEFQFADPEAGEPSPRLYRMKQTVVRRVRDVNPLPHSTRKAR